MAGRLLHILAFLLLVTGALASEEKDPNIRNAQTLDIQFPDGSTAKVSFAKAPIITDNGIISIIPGETFYVRFQRQGDQLKNPKLETNPRKTGDCVSFRFTNEEKLLMLNIKNPYEKYLHYRCGSMQHGGTGVIPRNNLPVMPKLQNFESYTGKDVVLLFRDFQLCDTYDKPKK